MILVRGGGEAERGLGDLHEHVYDAPAALRAAGAERGERDVEGGEPVYRGGKAWGAGDEAFALLEAAGALQFEGHHEAWAEGG